MTEVTDAVRRSAEPETRAEFDRRVRAQAAAVVRDARAGRLDNRDFAVGLELEAYAVDAAGRLASVPRATFAAADCSPELGVHNVEVHTRPDVASDPGFRRQATELKSALARVRTALAGADRRLVLDGMWTVPPPEGTSAYLGDGAVTEGVFLARRMRPAARYVALDNEIRARTDGRIPIGLPGLGEARSILVESLTTSMQPHLQIPTAADLPRYLNVATRTMGPVLSLAANSPFLPADCYEGLDAEEVLPETPHECRVRVFERSVDSGSRKCRVPGDFESVEDAVERIVADETLAPALREETADPETDAGDPDTGDRSDAPYADSITEFRRKRGTYWRWVRPVFGGDAPRGPDGRSPSPGDDDRSVRIEYRPLPTQPTVRDTVGMQAFVVGLVRGVVVADHPAATLPWEDARDSFYAAVDDGPGADVRWIASDGDPTDDPSAVRDEAFSLARRGLRELGVGEETTGWLLAPIEARRGAAHASPSAWKRARVRERVDAGDSLPEAIRAMQAAYVERAATGRPFADW
jgi:hypothetical protein